MNCLIRAVVSLVVWFGAASVVLAQAVLPNGGGGPMIPNGASGGGGGGINQLTGAVTAGPGSGSQVATIPPGQAGTLNTGCQATGGTALLPATVLLVTLEKPRTATGVNDLLLATDCGGLVNYTQASADAPQIPGAGSPGFENGKYFNLCNVSAFNKTYTAISGTIGGAATKVLNAASRSSPQCMWIISDVTNNDWSIAAGIVPASPTIVAGSTPTSGITSGDVVGSAANVIVDTGVAYANLPLLGGANIFTNPNTFSGAGAASTSSVLFRGIPFTGGSGSSTFPAVLIQPSNATASAIFSTTGTVFGINGHTGTANCLDIEQDGVSKMVLTCNSAQLTTTGSIQSTNATAAFTVGASGQFTASGRGIWTSPAAGTWQSGAGDAASPVAQTIQAQSVLSPASNGSGALFTIGGSKSTGSGGGDLAIQTTLSIAAATTQNTLATGLLMKGGTQSVALGSAGMTTSAGGGFAYLAAAAGTPTGTPESISGFVPMYLDTTNSQLWLYLGGAWKQPKTPAGAALVTWQ